MACAPLYLGSLLGGWVVDRLEEHFDARARVLRVSFSWPARLHLEGLELVDHDGAPLFSLDDAYGSFALLPLLSGELQGELELAYPELHIAREKGGRWNWEQPLEKVLTTSEEGEDGETSSVEDYPRVQLRLRLTDGHVVIHGPDAETTLADISFEADVEGLERPAPFRLALSVRGPAGPAGGLSLEGSVTAAAEGRLELMGLEGDLHLALRELDMAAFQPALTLIAPVEGLGGRMNGEGQLTLQRGLTLEGQTDIELGELTLRGPRGGDLPSRIERILLRGRATQQDAGLGTQRLELSADSFLSMIYEGSSNLPETGAGQALGTLTLSGDLARLTEISRAWFPIRPGVEVRGRLQHTLEIGMGFVDRKASATQVRARGGLENLTAIGAEGNTLALGELRRLALELDASIDLPAKLLDVSRLSLIAGPVTCEGHAQLADFVLEAPERAALRNGALHLEADLERLRGPLSQVVDLEALPPFGGEATGDFALEGQGDELNLVATLRARALRFGDATLATMDGELGARRSADGTMSGSGELNLGTLSLGEPPRPFPGVRLRLTLQEDAGGRGSHGLELETLDRSLHLVLESESERRGEDLELKSTLRLDGHVGRLAALATPFIPLQPGLAGTLQTRGAIQSSWAGTSMTQARVQMATALTDLTVHDGEGTPQRLEALARTTLDLEGELDVAAGTAELRSLRLLAIGLELQGSGRSRAPSRGALPELEAGRLELEVDLDRLGRELGQVVDLNGWGIAGSTLAIQTDLSTRDQRIEAKGRLTADDLRLSGPDSRDLELAALRLDYDFGFDSALGSLHLRQASLRSRTATLEMAGTLNELLTPERARGAMQIEVAGRLERILGDLGFESPLSPRRTSGGLEGKFSLKGDRGAFGVVGRCALDDFRLELTTEEEAPLVVEEPSILLECEAQVTLPALDIDLTKVTLDSGLARGGAKGRIENLRGLESGGVLVKGLTGELAYVPDRLDPLLAPFLPGRLSGAEEQRLTFSLDGRARDFDLASLMASSEARLNLGFGVFELPEVLLEGSLSLESKGENLRVHGDLTANGGALQLDATLVQPSEETPETKPPRSRLTVAAREVEATPGLAPLLALVHPAFATAHLTQGSLEGSIGLNLDLTYDGPLTLEDLAAGWEALPKSPIHGTGRLEVREAKLANSPLLATLASFGVDGTKALDLKPIEFSVQKGRVRYAKPWTWTLSATETTFTGSVGLDQSLDLAWNLPVTDQLIARWSHLSSLKGESLSIPLRGSVAHPRLETQELLADLAAKAASNELKSRLGLGSPPSADDPAELLKRADHLWGQNERTKAAALYSRIRQEFKLSLTYALNKDRIKDRSAYQAPKRE